MSNAMTLTFEDTVFSVIDRDGNMWLRGDQIGPALGYTSEPSRAVRKLYERNADEFTSRETCVLKLRTQGGMQQVRVFSLRGARMVALFAKTEIAKRFRAWVLDQLEREDIWQNNHLPVAHRIIFTKIPRWKRMKALSDRGFSVREIASTVGYSRAKVEAEMLEMYDAGMIDTPTIRLAASHRDRSLALREAFLAREDARDRADG